MYIHIYIYMYIYICIWLYDIVSIYIYIYYIYIYVHIYICPWPRLDLPSRCLFSIGKSTVTGSSMSWGPFLHQDMVMWWFSSITFCLLEMNIACVWLDMMGCFTRRHGVCLPHLLFRSVLLGCGAEHNRGVLHLPLLLRIHKANIGFYLHASWMKMEQIWNNRHPVGNLEEVTFESGTYGHNYQSILYSHDKCLKQELWFSCFQRSSNLFCLSPGMTLWLWTGRVVFPPKDLSFKGFRQLG